MGELENEGIETMGAIPLHRRIVDVHDLLVGAIQLLREQAEALDVELVVDGTPGAARVSIDPEKIAWAVTTLVGNALRHVRKGSRRTVGGTIGVRIDVQGRWLRIAVEDDGPGLPEEKLAVLFARTGEVRHGVGLGLLMIRDVVVAHGGDVQVTSRLGAPDHGTSVVMRIPLDGAKPTRGIA
jgi:signal transduction histidine kinase